MKKHPWRSISILLCLIGGAIGIGSFAPGPIEGFWYSKILDCACESRNLVEFKDGVAVRSSDHNDEKSRGPLGMYSKEGDVWVWRVDRTGSELELHPTWFFIRIVDRTHGERIKGYRQWCTPSISDSRSKKVKTKERHQESDSPSIPEAEAVPSNGP